MRRLLLPLLCVLSFAAFASADNPVDALKKSLHKPEPVTASHATTRKPVVMTWMSLSRARREKVLDDWQALPETTRDPFPVYRDGILEKESGTVLKAATPHLDVKKTDAK